MPDADTGEARTDEPSKKGGKPGEWALFWVQVAGVAAVVGTIAVAVMFGISSGKDTRKAIEQMTSIARTMRDQQQAILNQSRATENLASETNTVAVATQSQAATSATNAKAAQGQLEAANRQLAQNLDIFAQGHRPMLDIDPDGPHANDPPLRMGNEVRWNYGYKNFGAGPAFNVTVYDGISLYRGPIKEVKKIGSKMTVPGASQFGTAHYFVNEGEDRPGQFSYPRLRVRFVYSDGLGRRYEDTSCRWIDTNGTVVDCSYNPDERVNRKGR